MSLEEERMLILQMVADKKISAAEAAELLQALDGVYGGGAAPNQEESAAFDMDRTVRDAEQTVRDAAQTISENARQMARDAADAARREDIGGLFERLFDRFNLEFGGDGRVEFQEVHEGAFTIDQPQLNLQTGNGKLHVHGWDEPGYRVVLSYRVRGARDEAEAKERVRDRVTFEATGEGLTLNGHHRWFSDKGITVNAELWLPRDRRYRLHGRTGNGSLHAMGLPLVIGDMSSGNGAVRVERVTGDLLKLTTGNGSITIEADVTECTAGTGNGSLKFRPSGTAGRQVRLTTGNGSARIDLSALPKSTGYRLDASTGMGSIHMHLTDVVMERNTKTVGHKHLVAHSRNYAETAERIDIKVSTGMGSITLE